jgi:hypothetical protein
LAQGPESITPQQAAAFNLEALFAFAAVIFHLQPNNGRIFFSSLFNMK